MDPSYTEQAEVFRAQIRAFLSEQLPAGWSGMGALSPGERRAFIEAWRPVLAEHDLLAVAWPRKYGGWPST